MEAEAVEEEEEELELFVLKRTEASDSTGTRTGADKRAKHNKHPQHVVAAGEFVVVAAAVAVVVAGEVVVVTVAGGLNCVPLFDVLMQQFL